MISAGLAPLCHESRSLHATMQPCCAVEAMVAPQRLVDRLPSGSGVRVACFPVFPCVGTCPRAVEGRDFAKGSEYEVVTCSWHMQ